MLTVEAQALLHTSFQTRCIHPRLHYDTLAQARRWKLVNEAHSPAVRRQDTQGLYDKAFRSFAERSSNAPMTILSLGCGSGAKDARLLQALAPRSIHYLPCDVSASLAIDAMTAAQAFSHVRRITPLVCDLNEPAPIQEAMDSISSPRLFLFLGVIPNMDPSDAAACLRRLLRPSDTLILSANLLPQNERAWENILPQYDNAETRDWLLTLFDEIHLPRDSGKLIFTRGASSGPDKIPRIEARFEFARARRILLDDEEYDFKPGDSLLLFFSNRFTPVAVNAFFQKLGLRTPEAWMDEVGEEGVFISSS